MTNKEPRAVLSPFQHTAMIDAFQEAFLSVVEAVCDDTDDPRAQVLAARTALSELLPKLQRIHPYG